MDRNKLWKILQEMGIPDDLTCLLRNLYAGQEAVVRTRHGTTDWEGLCQSCILSHCLFNLYEEYIMQNAGLDEAQAGVRIARRNINNLRYADDTTLMAESGEELKSLLMKVKEESEKAGLKLNSGHRTGKGQFSFQSQRKAITQNVQTTTQIALISHASKVKSSKLGFNST